MASVPAALTKCLSNAATNTSTSTALCRQTTRRNMSNTPLSIRPGEIARITLPFSEACCHMRVAGKEMYVELLASGEEDPRGGSNVQYGAQLYRDDLTKFSFPITLGEAGIFRNEG